MRVHLYTWQKCPVCGKSFKRDGDLLSCPTCKTKPGKVYLKWVHDHEQFTTSPTDSQQAALRLACKIELELQEKRFDPCQYRPEQRKAPQKWQLVNLFREWVEVTKAQEVEHGNLSPGYLIHLRSVLPKLEAFKWPSDIREVRSGHIQNFWESMPKELSLKTQKNILDILRSFFADQYRFERVPKMPVFPKIKVEEKLRGWIDRETQDRIYAEIHSCHRPIFDFLRHSGQRPAETMALKRRNINNEQRAINIVDGISAGIVRHRTKGKQQWQIPLTKQIEEIIDRQPVDLRTEFVFWYQTTSVSHHRSTKKEYTRTLFFERYGEKKLRQIWHEACAKAGVTGVDLYTGTRHSFGTQMVNDGVALGDIQMMMGHTTPATTKKYAKVDKLRRLHEVFGNKIMPMKKEAK